MPAFEKALKDNGQNGFLVGSKLSIADIGLLEVILTVDELLGNDQLNDYTEIKVIFIIICLCFLKQEKQLLNILKEILCKHKIN
jgi:hypothetical protein